VEQTDNSLASRITLAQLSRWIAFYRAEPFGQDWRRTARLSVAVAASMGAKPPTDAEELFMPGFDPNRTRQTEEEMAAELAKLAALKRTRSDGSNNR
jgi:hypothetical protein